MLHFTIHRIGPTKLKKNSGLLLNPSKNYVQNRADSTKFVTKYEQAIKFGRNFWSNLVVQNRPNLQADMNIEEPTKFVRNHWSNLIA